MPGASLHSHGALGYKPMATGPQRHGIPRRCLFRTLPASRVSFPDNTHARSLNEEDGDGEVLGENEWARATLSWILQLALVAMEIL